MMSAWSEIYGSHEIKGILLVPMIAVYSHVIIHVQWAAAK